MIFLASDKKDLNSLTSWLSSCGEINLASILFPLPFALNNDNNLLSLIVESVVEASVISVPKITSKLLIVPSTSFNESLVNWFIAFITGIACSQSPVRSNAFSNGVIGSNPIGFFSTSKFVNVGPDNVNLYLSVKHTYLIIVFFESLISIPDIIWGLPIPVLWTTNVNLGSSAELTTGTSGVLSFVISLAGNVIS